MTTHDTDMTSSPLASHTDEIDLTEAVQSVDRPESGEESASEGEVLRQRCELLGIDWLEEAPESVEPEATASIQADVAARLRVVPLGFDGLRLVIAMAEPLDADAADEVATLAGRPVTRVGVDAKVFSELMREHYGTTAATMAAALAGDADSAAEVDDNLGTIEADDIHRMAEQPTLINLVNLLLLEAIQQRTSDVHIEPFENELLVKYRVDGVLVVQPPPPKHLQPALIGRIKIMSGMNIAERYVPQDGHITLRFEGRKVDIRVSTVPTLYGESVVMRILDKSALPLDLKSLGMPAHLRAEMDKMISKPHGMVLVTGPTGSGKTTTLYAALSKLYDPRKKIITIEDPVEYELHGINQMPVNPKRGLTFATGLRAILRQDPDVIFVGEIRDNETAEIAVRSALTGHLIFSTLHTNDAISSIGRLTDMGVEPFLVASVLEGVLAQRLGRRLDEEQREHVPMTEDVAHRLTASERAMFDGKMWQTTAKDGGGYYGRLGFFELIKVNSSMRQAISSGVPISELRKHLDSDFKTMRENGLQRAAEGMTTIDEVLRATQDVDDE